MHLFDQKSSRLLVFIFLLSSSSLGYAALVSVPWGTNTGTTTNGTGSTVFNTTNTLTWAVTTGSTVGAEVANSSSQIAVTGLGAPAGGLETATLTISFDQASDFQLTLGNIKVGEFFDSFSINPTSVDLSTTPTLGGESFHSWDGSALTSTGSSSASADSERSTFLWQGITSLSIDLNSELGPNGLTAYNARAATTIPEPSALVLAGSAVLLIGYRRRARQLEH